LRKGRSVTVAVALRAAPEVGRDDIRNLSGYHPLDGARVANLLPSIAEELGLAEQEGVVILSVRGGSTAASLGFRPGDIVVQVGREPISSVNQLERAVRERQRVWQIGVKRGDRILQLQIAG
jgi:S1-C subfamily serine protease